MKKTIPPSLAKDPEIDEEERELFLNAFYQNVSLQDKKTSYPSSKTPHPAVKTNEQEESDRELFLRAVNEGGFFSHSSQAKKKEAIPTKRQARRRDKIDGALDLHGLFAEQAIERLLSFIAREKARGSKTLLIVHGKGSGVLKNAVWAIAETNPTIEDFQVAPGKYGGD